MEQQIAVFSLYLSGLRRTDRQMDEQTGRNTEGKIKKQGIGDDTSSRKSYWIKCAEELEIFGLYLPGQHILTLHSSQMAAY